MQSWDVRVFDVPDAPAGALLPLAKPKELSPATVKAGSVRSARANLSKRFEGEGRKVRSINLGPNDRTGKTEFIVYLHGE